MRLLYSVLPLEDQRYHNVRGQMRVIMIIAMALLVLIIVGINFKSKYLKSKEENTLQDISQLTREERSYIESIEHLIDEAVRVTVDEMGKHGGYLSSRVPNPSKWGIPFYFYYGKVVNIPTRNYMERMLAKGIASVIRNRGANLYRFYSDKEFYFSIGDVKANIYDNRIDISMNVRYTIKRNRQSILSNYRFHRSYAYRLGYLQRIAADYLADLEVNRSIEKALVEAMIFNPEIPDPGGSAADPFRTTSCTRPVIYKTKQELRELIGEAAFFSLSKQIRRIKNLTKYEDVSWSFRFNKGSLNLSFVANKEYGSPYASENVVYFVPDPSSPMSDVAHDICGRKYSINYTISYPATFVIVDRNPSYYLQTSPLEFRFNVMAYFKSGNISAAVETSLPRYVDSVCHGQCNLEVEINNRAGTVFIDECDYSYVSQKGKIKLKNIPCGIKKIRIISSDPTNLADFLETVNIGRNTKMRIRLRPFIRLWGRVFMRDLVYCRRHNIIEDHGLKPLVYVEGEPPKGIIVELYSLNRDLNSSWVIVNEKGIYEFRNVIPSEYLLIAYPIRDSNDIAGYKVRPTGKIIDLREYAGESMQVDIKMDPMGIKEIDGAYYPISSTEDC